MCRERPARRALVLPPDDRRRVSAGRHVNAHPPGRQARHRQDLLRQGFRGDNRPSLLQNISPRRLSRPRPYGRLAHLQSRAVRRDLKRPARSQSHQPRDPHRRDRQVPARLRAPLPLRRAPELPRRHQNRQRPLLRDRDLNERHPVHPDRERP